MNRCTCTPAWTCHRCEQLIEAAEHDREHGNTTRYGDADSEAAAVYGGSW